MGLKEFRIEYDRPFATYIAGETVSGKVILTVDSTKTVRAIKVSIKGYARVHWTKDRSTSGSDGKDETVTDSYNNNEEYFSTMFYALGSDSGEKIELHTGTHIYLFTFNLLPNLPSSFEGRCGHIRYTVKATLDRPWKFNQDSITAFTVLSLLDLNELPHVSKPIMLEKSKTFCYLCCGSPPLTVTISLPVTGYVPGQDIPVKVDVENHSGVVISKLKLVLQKVQSVATVKSKIQEVKITEVCSRPIGGNETTSYEQSLRAPPLPPSNLKHCNIIHLEYGLKIETCVTGCCRRNLVLTTPIFIGTKPLLNFQLPYPKIHTPSAPPPEALLSCSSLNSSHQPDIAPPSYEECMFRSNGVRSRYDSANMIGAKESFAPRYPVYNFNAG